MIQVPQCTAVSVTADYQSVAAAAAAAAGALSSGLPAKQLTLNERTFNLQLFWSLVLTHQAKILGEIGRQILQSTATVTNEN
jgi:hypothetical protein